VTTGDIKRAKLQLNRHHKQTNSQFLQAGCPSCRPINTVKVLKRNTISKKLNFVNCKCKKKLSAENFRTENATCITKCCIKTITVDC